MSSDLHLTLEELIRSINTLQKLPMPLPLTHVSTANNLNTIMRNGAIKPLEKRVGDDRELCYLFYGGLFYRFSKKDNSVLRHSETALNFAPIAFVFKPIKLLRKVYRCFP